MAMDDGRITYSYDQLHDRFWQITPAAWVIAKSSTPELRTADLEDVQMLPVEPDGATFVMKIKAGKSDYGQSASTNAHLAIILQLP